MFSADGIIRSALKVLDIEPDEANEMIRRVVGSVTSVDERLARIEAHLGIEPQSSLDDSETTGEANNGAEIIGIENGNRN